MRYLDSGSRDPVDTLYSWLDEALVDATFFGCQTGYFAYDGIFPLEKHLEDLLGRSGALRLVVGANEASLRRADLEDVLELFDRVPTNPSKSLVIAAADDLLMHPKTFYVEKTDGSRHALVGSANLTHAGLSRNIEAGLAIDSVHDPAAPFDEIRAAIERWHLAPRTNGRLVTGTTLPGLVSQGILDQPRAPRTAYPPAHRRNRAATFPGMGAILVLPRKKRRVVPTRPATRPATPAIVPVGTLGTLPNGAVGILKRLTALDTKTFNGGSGTPYIALPSVLATYLPMTPSGVNAEPRLQVSVEVRLDTAPAEVVRSGTAPTNITHVGAGVTATSHRDLRFNYLAYLARGIEAVAAAQGVATPAKDHLVALELLAGALVRVTFVTDPAAIASLTPLLDQRGGNWGWLPPAILAGWQDDDDDA